MIQTLRPHVFTAIVAVFLGGFGTILYAPTASALMVSLPFVPVQDAEDEVMLLQVLSDIGVEPNEADLTINLISDLSGLEPEHVQRILGSDSNIRFFVQLQSAQRCTGDYCETLLITGSRDAGYEIAYRFLATDSGTPQEVSGGTYELDGEPAFFWSFDTPDGTCGYFFTATRVVELCIK